MADLRVHGATVIVSAPVHEVYQLFTHFDQFPHFMKFIEEVKYLDKDHQRTHWVADVFGHDEWDAVNEDWIEDRQIGWRSTSGLKNSGKVEFSTAGPGKTWVNVQVMYDPPAGFIGEIINDLAASDRFDEALQESMNEFARLVDTAPPGGLDSHSAHYVFGQNVAPNPSGVSHMQEAGPILAPGEPQDMVRQPITGNMVDAGMTPLDLGTVGGGQIPMPTPVPENANQAAEGPEASRIEDVADKTGEANPAEPPHEEQGSERRLGDFLRERGFVGQNPDIMASHEATPANEEENRPQTVHVQDPEDTGREID